MTDGDRSAQWWHDVLGFALVVQVDQPGFRVWGMLHRSGVYVGLTTHSDSVGAAFDERAVGLDHLALNVADRSALEDWVNHLDHLGVPHSEIKEENGGPLITLRDPDNIQLELHAYDPRYVVM